MTVRHFGTDPEFFITDGNIVDTEHGKICNVIPPAALIADMGIPFTLSKNNKRILVHTDDYNWIEDGAALELNINHPVKSSGEMYKTVISAKNDIKYFLSQISDSLKIASDVLGYFDITKFWEGRDESFLQCVMFGCDPDIFPNLYMMLGFEEDTCKITDASKHTFRYAGGHIHTQNMSNNPDVYVNNAEFASILYDYLVGTANILLKRNDNILPQEKARLKYYGRPGRIRIQKYSDKVNGIEYRPPSNQWINDPYNISTILECANIAATIIEHGGAESFYHTFSDTIIEMWEALTTYNKKLANKLLVNSLTWAVENFYAGLGDLKNVGTIL
jgi:hypothetical protein